MLTYRFGIVSGLCVASLNLATPVAAEVTSKLAPFHLPNAADWSVASAAAAQGAPSQNATAAAFALPTRPAAQSADPFAKTRSAALKWEVAYQILSVVDAAQTISCLNRGTCEEANPIWGKHPKPATIILSKAVIGAAHFAVFQHLNERSPRTALRLAQISCVGQGGVVLLNARFTF